MRAALAAGGRAERAGRAGRAGRASGAAHGSGPGARLLPGGRRVRTRGRVGEGARAGAGGGLPLEAAEGEELAALEAVLRGVQGRLAARAWGGGGAGGEEALVGAAREAVTEALDGLPRRFPQVVLAALQAAEEAGPEQQGMVEVLGQVYEETARQLRAGLPSAVRLLDLLCTIDRPGERLRTMAEAVQGGRSAAAAAVEQEDGRIGCEVPPCHPSEVVGACRHMVADLEGAAEVADRVLLSRVCLVREEARHFADRLTDEGTEVAVPGGRGTAWPSTLPQLECAFIAELVKAGPGEKRGALLMRALSGDLLEFSAARRRLSEADLKRMRDEVAENSSPELRSEVEQRQGSGCCSRPETCRCHDEPEEHGEHSAAPRPELLDAAQSEASIQAVRPGRLLDALMALEGEARAGLGGAFQPGGSDGAPPPSPKSVSELALVREEVLETLREIAHWKDMDEPPPLEGGELGR